MIIGILVAVFVLGYIAIAFEHSIRLNKAASALITGVLCWTIYILQSHSTTEVTEQLLHHLAEIASIVFFLLGAMTIVELIDSNHGFEIITARISTRSKSKLLFIITGVTFFLSALLDNLTSAIVMTSLCSKLIADREHKLWFAGMIVIAANAGGVWSPLGDVTTTMLWIGGQITALNIIKVLFIPGLFACIPPLLIVAYKFRGQTVPPLPVSTTTPKEKTEGKIILFAGIAFLVFVPLFKTITELPPFMGMLLALGCMWIITSILHKRKEPIAAQRFTVANALQKLIRPVSCFSWEYF